MALSKKLKVVDFASLTKGIELGTPPIGSMAEGAVERYCSLATQRMMRKFGGDLKSIYLSGFTNPYSNTIFIYGL